MSKARSPTCNACRTICGTGSTTVRRTRASRNASANAWKRSRNFARRRGVNCSVRRVAIASAGKGRDNDQGHDGQDGDDEDAAFRTGGSATEEGLAYGVGGEEMVLDHESAVGDTVEEGLGPIPRGVEADGPPERAGAPEAEAEDDSDQPGGEQSDGRFAGVLAMAEAEEDGEDGG